MAIAPKLKLDLIGDGINTFSESVSWTSSEQIEKLVSIVDTDGLKSINFSDIDDVQLVIFKSVNPFTITITTSTETQTIMTEGYFILTPSSTYWEDITTIEISTALTVAQNINIRIYGGTSA